MGTANKASPIDGDEEFKMVFIYNHLPSSKPSMESDNINISVVPYHPKQD